MDESLFILPNDTQVGGKEPFMFVLYTGSDSLQKYDALDKPYILVKTASKVPSVETLEGLTESTGLVEDDIIAVSGTAFLTILENPSDLAKHLYFAEKPLGIDQILGEQVLLLAIFHQLHFLASVQKLGIPYLTTSINERFDALRDILPKEQIATAVFGVPLKKMETYFNGIQDTYVGSDPRRTKTLSDLLELLQDPDAILSYFKEGLLLKTQPMTAPVSAPASVALSGNTRRGFNAISLASDEFNTTDVNASNTNSVNTVPIAAAAAPAVEPKPVPAAAADPKPAAVPAAAAEPKPAPEPAAEPKPVPAPGPAVDFAKPIPQYERRLPRRNTQKRKVPSRTKTIRNRGYNTSAAVRGENINIEIT
jgi:hypothetical protein